MSRENSAPLTFTPSAQPFQSLPSLTNRPSPLFPNHKPPTSIKRTSPAQAPPTATASEKAPQSFPAITNRPSTHFFNHQLPTSIKTASSVQLHPTKTLLHTSLLKKKKFMVISPEKRQAHEEVIKRNWKMRWSKVDYDFEDYAAKECGRGNRMYVEVMDKEQAHEVWLASSDLN